MDAPKRIWAWEIDHLTSPPNGYYSLWEVDDAVQFIRADLAPDAALVAELVKAGDRMRDLIAPIAHEFPSLVAAMNSWGAVLAKLEARE